MTTSAVLVSSLLRRRSVSAVSAVPLQCLSNTAAATSSASRNIADRRNAAARQHGRSYHTGRSFLRHTALHRIRSNNATADRCRLMSSASKRDFYDVLGVPKGADKAAIKKAYFKLAKQHHPDTNQGNEKAAEKFKEATEAYEVLTDDEKRPLYDQFGHAGVDPNFQAGGNPFGGGGGGFDFGDGSFHFTSSGPGGQIDPEDLFDAFFGGGARRQRGPRRGADLQMNVHLTFQEAVFGASKDVNLRYQVVDRSTGKAEIKEREVTVETPPGIDDGMNLRLNGQGAEGDPGAPRGNLIVQVVVDRDDYFMRDGANVHVEVPISVTQAILGGTVDVKTLQGEVEMKIPKGTQPDARLMMRGKGIQKLHSGAKGNQIVHLKIQIPTDITARQEELLREFDEDSAKPGITGKIAEAAESAFSSIFGSKPDKQNKKRRRRKDSDSKSKDDDSTKATDSDSDDESSTDGKKEQAV